MAQKTKKTIDILGPAFKHKQLPSDRHAAPTYSQRLYIFKLSEPEPVDAIVSTLQTALKAAVDLIPSLAGFETHGVPGPSNTRHVSNEDGKGALKLIINDLRHREDIAYQNLSDAQFPQDKLSSSDLAPIAGFGDWPECSPIAFIQANFVKGGLLMAVCISHVVMDGVSISNFVKMIGSMSRDIQEGQSPKAILSKNAFNAGIFENAVDLGPENKEVDIAKVISRHPAYRYFPEGATMPPVPGSPWLRANIAKIVNISSDAVKELVGDIRTVHPHVSKHDAVVALLWRSVVKANTALGRTEGSVSEVTMPVDIRRLEGLELKPEYIGNAYYLINCKMPQIDLLATNGMYEAAAALRKTINGLSAEQVRDFYELFETAGDHAWIWTILPSMVGLVYSKAQGFFMTSHYYQDLDVLDFGPLFGRVTSFRLPKEGVGGIMTVLPKASKRMTEGFEISMEWDQQVWGMLERDELFNKYTRVIG